MPHATRPGFPAFRLLRSVHLGIRIISHQPMLDPLGVALPNLTDAL